jgi:hypothetical protein
MQPPCSSPAPMRPAHMFDIVSRIRLDATSVELRSVSSR